MPELRMTATLISQLQQHLEQLQPEALGWLESMVGINSFTANMEGVNELGRLTAQCFAELGFVPEQVPSQDAGQGSHLYLSRARPGAKRVLLVSHLDTVFPPEEEARNDFRWQVSAAEGRIYGPGVIDIKGGTILIWMLLHALRECVPDVFESTDWLIAFNAAEEVMSRDFARCTTERCPAGAEAVLVFEGGPVENGEYHLVASRKGRAEYRLTSIGRGAHAGSALDRGLNAIVALAEVLPGVAALNDPARDFSLNIGRITGGTVLNRVPHEAIAELEMRAYDPRQLEQAGQRLAALQRPMTETQAGLQVQCLGVSPAWPCEDRARRLMEHWQAAAADLGLQAKPVPRGGLSDANYLCHLGPTLDGLGPAGGNAHCSERSADGSKVPEYLETASLVPKAMMNVLALRRLLAG